MKNYSLKELAMMRASTLEEIKEKLEAIPTGTTCTAQELVKATDGLATVRHIVSTIIGNGQYDYSRGYCGSGLIAGSYEDVRFSIHHTTKRVTKHLAELDEEGNIVRKFDVHPQIEMNLYTKTN